MTDTPSGAPAAPSQKQDFAALAKELFAHMEPLIVNAAKAAVGIVSPIAGAVVQPALDVVDQLVRAHNPSIAQAESGGGHLVQTGPVVQELPSDTLASLQAQVKQLQVNVAALLIATRNDNSAAYMMAKSQIVAASKAAEDAASSAAADGSGA